MVGGHHAIFGNLSLALRVECYSGYRGEETPRRFFLRTRQVDIRKIIDRWLGPDYRYFKIQGDDGNVYLLKYACGEDVWSLEFFGSPQLSAGDQAVQ